MKTSCEYVNAAVTHQATQHDERAVLAELSRLSHHDLLRVVRRLVADVQALQGATADQPEPEPTREKRAVREVPVGAVFTMGGQDYRRLDTSNQSIAAHFTPAYTLPGLMFTLVDLDAETT